jgi:outer membrane protein TolC
MFDHRKTTKNCGWTLAVILIVIASCSRGFGQGRLSPELTAALVEPQDDSTQAQSAPLTLTLQDALERALKNDAQYLSVVTDASVAHEDRVQARAALLPSINLRSEYLNTQGNGVLPSGRYVTNDGVHVYREWGVFHQDFSPTVLLGTGYRRAAAAEAQARAKAEIARRGLAVTVTRAYYALITAQRKYATAQQALEQAKNLLTIGQNLEKGGEVAHSDVIKFELQDDTQDRAFREAKLAMAGARLDLAVLLFHQFDQNFDIVDDLKLAPALPSFGEVQELAKRENPDLRVAIEALRAANQDVSIARQAFLPSLAVDVDYGIEANSFALRSLVSGARSAGRLPNLGYFLTATMTVPVWNWGGTRSKLRQAELKRQQAKVELSATQRQLLRNLYGFYQEAETAKEEVASLRHSAERAAESLRLTTLRYQAGEATVLEVVDAQNTLTQTRNAYDDGDVRYSVALANVQTVTGRF